MQKFKQHLIQLKQRSAGALTKAAYASPLVLFAASARADLPEDVTTAITAAKADIAAAGALVITIVVGIKVWKWITRVF